VHLAEGGQAVRALVRGASVFAADAVLPEHQRLAQQRERQRCVVHQVRRERHGVPSMSAGSRGFGGQGFGGLRFKVHGLGLRG